MSWVDDARKLMQDFAALELRALSARLDANERSDVERDQFAAERHAALLEKPNGLCREVKLQIDLALATRRVEELERRQQGLSSQTDSAPTVRI